MDTRTVDRSLTFPERAVSVQVGPVHIRGDLVVPREAIGLVIFAHGSGSSRMSPRNRFVAGLLNRARLGTLLADLLTPQEEEADRYSREYRFDIPMLARRICGLVAWAKEADATAEMPVGLFGASTGAAAALVAAALRPGEVDAVVSRGGRPDLAGAYLPAVLCPTLLIVGGQDDIVIDLNRKAMAKMRCERALEIVPGATHLFEEPGTLEAVAGLARDWFQAHLEMQALVTAG
jgi:pimeloyl-ACP methyl ester carboxylesterase